MREERSAEFSGKNVEDAISKGLAELGLRREEVEVHVITPGSRGVLGFGAENARVRLDYSVEVAGPVPAALERQAPVAPVVAEPEPIELEPEPATASVVEEQPTAAFEVADADSETLTPIRDEAEFKRAQQLAIEVLQRLLDGMGVRTTVAALPPQGLMAEQASEGPAIILDIRGEDLGILIGRRGETLAALQYMVRLIVSRQLKQWLNILLDVEQYRARRERGLRQLALRMAERVAQTQQPIPLEAMTSYDRRVVHLALHDHQAVTTRSIGEGDSRKVVIMPRNQG